MFEKFHSFFGSCKLFLVFLFLTVASFTIFGGVLHLTTQTYFILKGTMKTPFWLGTYSKLYDQMLLILLVMTQVGLR